MTYPVPTKIPESLIIGDTWSWTRDLADFPASTWELTYYFKNGDNAFSITASASGDRQSVSVPAATTAAYKAGEYRYRGSVSDGADRHTLDSESGIARLIVDPAAAGKIDSRSWERQVMEALQATILGRASSDQLAMSISGRSISLMTLTELRENYERFRAMAATAERIEALAQGRPTRNRLQVRF